jgi:hypothetical protein
VTPAGFDISCVELAELETSITPKVNVRGVVQTFLLASVIEMTALPTLYEGENDAWLRGRYSDIPHYRQYIFSWISHENAGGYEDDAFRFPTITKIWFQN